MTEIMMTQMTGPAELQYLHTRNMGTVRDNAREIDVQLRFVLYIFEFENAPSPEYRFKKYRVFWEIDGKIASGEHSEYEYTTKGLEEALAWMNTLEGKYKDSF